MTWTLPIIGEYPANWKEISDATCAAVGHRCIRCGHPYEKGKHGKGEWSPCDDRCTHAGPLLAIKPEWVSLPHKISEFADVLSELPGNPLENTPTVKALIGCRPKGNDRIIVARWRILTVHHFDGNKANCQWWNLLPLCQRCHLQIQTRVNPHQPYMFEHSDWLKPYVAGFYSWKYEQRMTTRVDVENRIGEMDRLLALERIA